MQIREQINTPLTKCLVKSKIFLLVVLTLTWLNCDQNSGEKYVVTLELSGFGEFPMKSIRLPSAREDILQYGSYPWHECIMIPWKAGAGPLDGAFARYVSVVDAVIDCGVVLVAECCRESWYARYLVCGRIWEARLILCCVFQLSGIVLDIWYWQMCWKGQFVWCCAIGTWFGARARAQLPRVTCLRLEREGRINL